MKIKIEAIRHKDDHHMSEDEINNTVDIAVNELRAFIHNGSVVARDKSYKKEYDHQWVDPVKKADKEIDGQESFEQL